MYGEEDIVPCIWYRVLSTTSLMYHISFLHFRQTVFIVSKHNNHNKKNAPFYFHSASFPSNEVAFLFHSLPIIASALLLAPLQKPSASLLGPTALHRTNPLSIYQSPNRIVRQRSIIQYESIRPHKAYYICRVNQHHTPSNRLHIFKRTIDQGQPQV